MELDECRVGFQLTNSPIHQVKRGGPSRGGGVLNTRDLSRWMRLAALCMLLCGCAAKQIDLRQAEYLPPPQEPPVERAPEKLRTRPQPPLNPKQDSTAKAKQDESARLKQDQIAKSKQDLTVQQRAVTEKELSKWSEKDAALTVAACIEILCRLNLKDREYVKDDIKGRRPLRTPKDFTAYKDWTPLPRTLAGVNHVPKFILIVRDIPFLGWYERGRLVGDTYVCIGRSKEWTKRGLYKVMEKDPSHMSDYPNAYGDPALMPFALKVYERVWIHAGDVVGPNCSHGCINVPLFVMAQKLYNWSDLGTAVLITDSLQSMGKDLKTHLPAKPGQGQPKGPAKTDVKKLKS
jgi:hypothetical protein